MRRQILLVLIFCITSIFSCVSMAQVVKYDYSYYFVLQHDDDGVFYFSQPIYYPNNCSRQGIMFQFDASKNNIATLEDPVEYRIPWVNHTQINPSIWFDFASWLRSLLRQDPDIIMVWEIRDKETALLSIEAALTWHLVLSTIHTNSATATIQRLINMWIEPFLIASALKMVISQRLVKKICPHCRKVHNLDETLMWKVKNELSDIITT